MEDRYRRFILVFIDLFFIYLSIVSSFYLSDIDKYNNKLIVASLGAEIEQGDLSLYIYSLNENLEIKKREINKIYQRIRDIHIANDHVFLYLESTGSIGFFKIENLN